MSQSSNLAIIPMTWATDLIHDDKVRCAHCGRVITGEPLWVEIIDGGGSVAAPGLDPDQSDPGYMGFFPVGRTCARLHFKGFTHG